MVRVRKRWRTTSGRLAADIMLDVSLLSAIGPRAALGNLGSYLALRKRILSRVRQEKPDLALLVDFPDFNLPLARKLKQAGVPVCYFISPQLWAWRKSRVKQIRKYVDLMLVIFPFEEVFYREAPGQCRLCRKPYRGSFIYPEKKSMVSVRRIFSGKNRW